MKVSSILMNAHVAVEHSVQLAGGEPVLTNPSDAVEKALNEGREYCHFVGSKSLVMPDFYKAMGTTLEYANTDYVYCHAAYFGENPRVIELPTPESMITAQILIKSWVVEELDIFVEDLLKQALMEYKGYEVTHVLIAEMA